MVLKKYWIIFLLFTSSLSAQNLFFTDSYQTNLYAHTESQLVFNNDVFSIIGEENQGKVALVFHQYFEALDIDVRQIKTNNPSQIAFQYTTLNIDPLNWSKVWHQKYEVKLTLVLNSFLSEYFVTGIDYPTSIRDAAIKKQAYYAIRNYKNRISSYSKTRINISLANLNLKKFEEENLAPNLSLNRIVTNSFYSYFNEAYPVQDIAKSSTFVLGPNSKSKMVDCFSMHLFTKVNELSNPIYLSGHSVLILDSLYEFDNSNKVRLKALLPAVQNEILDLMNSLDNSFYNAYDKEYIETIREAYNLKDYETFIETYLNQNSYNIAQPVSNIEQCFNKAILEESVKFKLNSHQFLGQRDSLILNTLALFISNNRLDNVVILGFISDQEFTKIDRDKYLELVNKYKEYTPVKSSKKADLSIYRSVVVFDYLVSRGVNPRDLICISNNYKGIEDNFAMVKFSFK